MSKGKIVQIIGAVVDVEFPHDAIPGIYDALRVDEVGLTLEVQQQLGDGVVRCIAMGTTDGLTRGKEVTDTGAPISVPVGTKTLGRIMNVLGDPIDEKGDGGRGAALAHPPRGAPATTSCPPPPSCWRPASRSSTWCAPSPRAARWACSAAPAWARP